MPDHVKVTLTIEKELRDLARAYKINMSKALEDKLVEILEEKYGIKYYTKEYILENISKRRKGKLEKIVKVVEKLKTP